MASDATDNALELTFARSGAPSISTYNHRRYEAEDRDSNLDNEVQFMQMRPHPERPQPPEPRALDESFMSNGLVLNDIAAKVKECNDTLSDLHQLGIQHEISLPELVLVGDQSAGKSSLMSAIAGLRLPRGKGTCTRCPIHIRMSHKETWTCSITLQLDYDYQPAEGHVSDGDDDGAPAGANNRKEKWLKRQNRVVKEFKTIQDKCDTPMIEHVLRWAQIAVLNPSANHMQFVPRQGEVDDRARKNLEIAEQKTEAKFSPNTVALEIRGPDLADLSLYDLPGIFQTAPDPNDQYLAGDVEDICCEYISHPKAIILWAVPMNGDPENSSTLKIIRRAKAQKRTLGIMTKADLLSDGDQSKWVDMLGGKVYQIGLGYFVTSRPGREMDLELEQKTEEAFFNRAPGPGDDDRLAWPRAFSLHDDRCGVPRLKAFLSQKLSEAFAKSLPDVKRKLFSRLETVRTDLGRLPELPHNPELEIKRSLMEFTAYLKSSMQSQDFTSQWARIADEFRDRVLQMKPKYIVKDAGTRAASDGPIDLTADDDSASVYSMMSSPATERQYRRQVEGDFESPAAKRRRGVDGLKVEDVASSFTLGSNPVTPRANRIGPPPAGLGPFTGGVKSKTLPQLRDLIRSHRRPGMPNTVPDEVKVVLCREAVHPWVEPLRIFLEKTMNLLRSQVKISLDRALQTLTNRQIFKKSWSILQSFLEEQGRIVNDRLSHVYRMETRQLYTADAETCARHQESERKVLLRNRHYHRMKPFRKGDDKDRPLPIWEQMTPEQRQKEETETQKEIRQLGKDPFETEIEVAAYVRGYYLTAARRFIDSAQLNFTSSLACSAVLVS
ncbi:putative dynamin family protein [Phaeoacremonium minimum UCRPA7]|uniref:Putative dynamin family protein n=1 Tax=Phaeoacremonium minimum (strain UCR-PA7) TaxID=1286976 RepID=R8BD26_PHAM7|nr:putative dynamin family protein [Phaeoacremonium minimum UCRPA7]EON97208.1 putative dynamin family protein [Phaeoacremonium minimum UCRPA7]